MIEQTIRAHNGELTRTKLWKALPKKTMYQTFKDTLKYLEDSKKIIFNDKHVVWIFYPEMYEALLKQTKIIN
jgi:hypothetical protein